MTKPKIGITIGDMNGIGLEVILKTVANPNIFKICTPIIYGSSKVVAYHKNIVNVDFPFNSIRSAEQCEEGKVNIINCWQENSNVTIGVLSDQSGKFAQMALEDAVVELKNGLLDALVTAPINKKAMQMAGFPFPGHTEYLTQELGNGAESVMMLVNEGLRVALVTNHLPVAQIAENITEKRILQKIKILNQTLKQDFGIEKPTIAVLGLNPHAGDGGAIGAEETNIIRPAILAAKELGIVAMGPFPADGFFGSHQECKYDAVLAMYHDQGLVPFKTLAFGGGVNFTAGLSAIRTSPDHGTAYDIAGQNLADESSFRQAIYLAIDTARNRASHTLDHANPMKVKGKEKHLKAQDGDYVEE
jgi:4-hydroxythreonine-4-phosphate dehydrogenase